MRAFDSVKLTKNKKKDKKIENEEVNNNDHIKTNNLVPSLIKKKDEIETNKKTKTVRFTDDNDIIHL